MTLAHETHVTERVSYSSVLDIKQAIQICWKARRSLPYFIGVFVLLGIAYIHLAEPVYTVTATIGPPQKRNISLPNSGALLSSALGSGGLGGGALSGLIGGAGDDMFDEYLALLQSNRLAERLATKRNLLPIVFYKRWDPEKKAWKDFGLLQPVVDFVKAILGMQIKHGPDADDLAYVLEDLDVERSFQSSLVGLSLKFSDPEMGEHILNEMLTESDAIIRQDNYRDVSARIRYLQKQLQTTTLTDQRDVLIAILSNQQQSMMMLNADARIASTLVDRPHAPLQPTWPKLPIVLILSVFVGVVMWAVAALLVAARGGRPFQILDRLRHVYVRVRRKGWSTR